MQCPLAATRRSLMVSHGPPKNKRSLSTAPTPMRAASSWLDIVRRRSSSTWPAATCCMSSQAMRSARSLEPSNCASG
eukprot:4591153-Prymnesium_polylepis.1